MYMTLQHTSMATTQTSPESSIAPTPSNHSLFYGHLSQEAIFILSNLQIPNLHFHQDLQLLISFMHSTAL